MIHCETKITYRDDKVEIIECYDTPSVGDWIVLYPLSDAPTGRRILPKEAIASIEYRWKGK